jgi:hypothetical protein
VSLELDSISKNFFQDDTQSELKALTDISFKVDEELFPAWNNPQPVRFI